MIKMRTPRGTFCNFILKDLGSDREGFLDSMIGRLIQMATFKFMYQQEATLSLNLLSPFKQRKDFSELSEVQEKARRNLSNPLSEGSTDMTSGPAYYDPHAEVRTEQVDAGVGVNNQEGQRGGQ